MELRELMEREVVWIVIRILIVILGVSLADYFLFNGAVIPYVFGSIPGIAKFTWNNLIWVAGGIGILIIFLLFFVVWAINRGEKYWEFKKFKDRFFDPTRGTIRNWFFDKYDKLRAKTGLYRKAWTKRRLQPDYLPKILWENIIILFTLNNYLLRLYVWNVKFDQVRGAEHVCKAMWGF